MGVWKFSPLVEGLYVQKVQLIFAGFTLAAPKPEFHWKRAWFKFRNVKRDDQYSAALPCAHSFRYLIKPSSCHCQIQSIPFHPLNIMVIGMVMCRAYPCNFFWTSYFSGTLHSDTTKKHLWRQQWGQNTINIQYTGPNWTRLLSSTQLLLNSNLRPQLF